jgi:hypothetical protein
VTAPRGGSRGHHQTLLRRTGWERKGAGGTYVAAVAAEGLDGGEDVDGDAEQGSGGRDEAEAAAYDEERVAGGAPPAPPRRFPAASAAAAGRRRQLLGGPRRGGGRLFLGHGGRARVRWSSFRRVRLLEASVRWRGGEARAE